jgi:hypothetical protein
VGTELINADRRADVFRDLSKRALKTGHVALTTVATVYIGKSTKYPGYPACKLHLFFAIILILPGSTTFIFLHYLINGMIFEKNVIEHK